MNKTMIATIIEINIGVIYTELVLKHSKGITNKVLPTSAIKNMFKMGQSLQCEYTIINNEYYIQAVKPLGFFQSLFNWL